MLHKPLGSQLLPFPSFSPSPPLATSWPKRGQCRLRSPCSGCGRRDLQSPSPGRHIVEAGEHGARSSVVAVHDIALRLCSVLVASVRDTRATARRQAHSSLRQRRHTHASLDGIQEATGVRCAHVIPSISDPSVCVRARIMHLVHLLLRQEPEAR